MNTYAIYVDGNRTGTYHEPILAIQALQDEKVEQSLFVMLGAQERMRKDGKLYARFQLSDRVMLAITRRSRT